VPAVATGRARDTDFPRTKLRRERWPSCGFHLSKKAKRRAGPRVGARATVPRQRWPDHATSGGLNGRGPASAGRGKTDNPKAATDLRDRPRHVGTLRMDPHRTRAERQQDQNRAGNRGQRHDVRQGKPNTAREHRNIRTFGVGCARVITLSGGWRTRNAQRVI